MNKTLSLHMGNCNRRKYIPITIDPVRSGIIDPVRVLTQVEPLSEAIEAYRAFDSRQPGWMNVELKPDIAMGSAA